MGIYETLISRKVLNKSTLRDLSENKNLSLIQSKVRYVYINLKTIPKNQNFSCRLLKRKVTKFQNCSTLLNVVFTAGSYAQAPFGPIGLVHGTFLHINPEENLE